MGRKTVNLVVDTPERDLFKSNLTAPSDSSKRLYINQYDKIYNDGNLSPIYYTQELIKKFIDKIPNVQSKKNYLNIFAMVHKQNPSMYEYIDTQKKLLKHDIDKAISDKNQAKMIEIPEYQNLFNHLLGNFEDENYTGYLINYLLLTYGVRNKDLDVLFLNNDEEIPNTEDNFLQQIDKDTIEYTRYNYKTVAKYGVKVYHIKDKRFIIAFNRLKEKQEMLLTNRKVDYYIRKFTFNGLGEADVFRIIVFYYAEQGDLNKLSEYSQTRGSSLNNIVKDYNLKFKILDNDNSE
tara:strand:- start:2222 stop:3097 length:876 start_codon:yes stop_codon:yes gene_type:complete